MAAVNGQKPTNGYHSDASSSPRSSGSVNGTAQSSTMAPSMAFKPIAICGMACRLPGGIASPSELWDFLLAKGDARSEVPETRFNLSGYYQEPKNGHRKPGTTVTRHGYFLDSNIDIGALDTSFYPMARSEVEQLDPQVKLLLEVARECLDDAGAVDWRGGKVGAYVGSYGNDWYDVYNKDERKYGMYQIGTTHDFTLSNRLSYELDLRGPSVTIRTACSSGLIGLNEACAAIAKGDCSSAIVSGTNIIMAPALITAMSEQGVLNAEGSCKTFSAAADGYARGEAIVALYIKSLDDALRDGNPIRAVISGAATNSDGRTNGFSVPSAAAQEALIRHTYRVAGISDADVAKTGFVECHGTGTPVGDPIETKAVARVFGATDGDGDGVYIGSIKPNLGHSEGASGLTSVIKAVLSLEHRTIPPNIKAWPLNPKIPFESNKLLIPSEPTPWPADRNERISVNSFGVGGANAHVIIDSISSLHQQTTALGEKRAVASADTTTPHLLVYSANNQQSLKEMTQKYENFVSQAPDNLDLADLSYTLATRREHLPIRSFAVSTRDKPGHASVPSAPSASAKPPSIVMVFTGQGAQWPQMGRDLYHANPVFNRTIKSLDEHLQAINLSLNGTPLDWHIEEELLKPARTSRVNDAEFSQPLCTAIQLALIDTLAVAGIHPAAVVGHSSGEIAAAYAAGALNAREAIAVAFHRGTVTKHQTRPGAMAAVGMGWSDAEKYLTPGVVIACDNSPSSVTLSGDADAVKKVVDTIKEAQPEMLATLVKVNKAYHSHHMVEVGEDYLRALEASGVRGKLPSVAFFSSVTGKPFKPGQEENNSSHVASDHFLGPRYWQQNLESPVLFRGAVTSILARDSGVGSNPIFLEIGPHAALAGPIRQILTRAASDAPHIPTLSRKQNGLESFLTAIGKLWALQAPVNLAALMPVGRCLPDLPRYPWNHQRSHWYETRVSREWRLREHLHHDLLGARVAESSETEPVWRNLLHLDNVPWIRDHKIHEDIVFPFAGYVAIAAEAARQVSNIQEGVELRNVSVQTALVVPDESNTPIELITTLRRHRLTDSQDSEWWEFAVVAHNGRAWTKHAVGEVRATTTTAWGDGSEVPSDEDGAVSLPRRVNMPKYYERVRRGGLAYGYHFVSVDSMRTATGGPGRAKAWSRNNWHGDEENYHLHPVVLDTYLQVQNSAAQHALTHRYQQFVPLSVALIQISRCNADQLILVSTAERAGDGFIGNGSVVATVPPSFPQEKSTTRTVLKVTGVHIGPLDTSSNVEDATGTAMPMTARQEWVPHIDFTTNLSLLVKPSPNHLYYAPKLDRLSRLAITLAKRTISAARVQPVSPSMREYKAWLDQLVFDEDGSGVELETLDQMALESQIETLVSELVDTPATNAAAAIRKVSLNAVAIVSETGTVEDAARGTSFDILSKDDTLSKLDAWLKEYDASAFIYQLALSKPNLRVLELGAGDGTAALHQLQNLKRPDGQILYSSYMLTDAHSGMIAAAREKFTGSASPQVEFATLDISKDPADQGFDNDKFDLIVATGTLHAIPDLPLALRHVAKLLRPDGRLLVQQPRPDVAWTTFVFNSLPGRWNLDRASLDTWRSALVEAGFQDSYDKNLVTSPLVNVLVAQQRSEKSLPKQITLLCGSTDETTGNAVADELVLRGFEVTRSTDLYNACGSGQDILALLDFEAPFFESIDTHKWQQLKSSISLLGDSSSSLFWVTRPTQTGCEDPRYAPVVGFARTMRSETGINFAVCETDEDVSSPAGSASVTRVFYQFLERLARNEEDDLDPDFEYAIRQGTTHTNRFFPFELEQDIQALQPSTEFTLKIARSNRIDSLQWVPLATATAPKGDEVEVEVHATGLNFRDVLVAMGIISLSSREPYFGYEATGVVKRVGPEVKKLKVGDRALLTGIKTFSTVVTSTELLVDRLPDDLSFVDGASMPLVFTTAIYSLINIGQLEKGQSVLIHSGCGGVGLAAIQIAQMLGAEVYTTVSNDEKVNYLMETYGLPRDHILNSRSASFVDDLLRMTQGKGVDVALNSLAGELLHATWRCIAKWGTMVEIGKRDLLGRAKLDMDVFLANRNYCCVDIDQMREERPYMADRLLRDMMNFYRAGHIRPVRIAKVARASEVQETFRYMQQGSHIGKIVVTLRDHGDDVTKVNSTLNLGPVASRVRRELQLKPDASYLLIGGLGGLGRTVAIWMVEHGARHLIFLSRSAGVSLEDQQFAVELNSMGCAVEMVRGSVVEREDVTRALAAADESKPLAGVVQMSMVLRDTNFANMTLEEWNTATAPKIQGTWNLHEAMQASGLKPDFFVLFSSISGVLGNVGQSNYAAANTFLDAFVQFRQRQGLACSAIDIGAMEGAGYLFENAELLRKMQGTGWRSVKEEELLEALEAAMLPRLDGDEKVAEDTQRSSIIVDKHNMLLGIAPDPPFSSPNSSARLRKDARMAVWHNVSVGQSSSGSGAGSDQADTLRTFLASAKADPALFKTPDTAVLLARKIGKKLFALLLKPDQEPTISSTLADAGLDSMIAVEMRAWWKLAFGLSISVLDMLAMGTLEALGKRAADELADLYQV